MNKSIVSALVAAGFAVATAPLTMAQTANPPADEPQVRHHAQRLQHGQHAARLPGERIEARIAYLKTALKITDAQQPQWNAFADTLRKQAREMDQRIQARRSQRAQGPKHAKPTAIDRLQFRQERLAASSARLNETLMVAKPLYAALTPEQQTVADELLAPRRHGMFHRKGMHRAA
jgi:Spy/CpxP family protein refolding chaperone